MTFTYVVTYFLVALSCSLLCIVVLAQLTSDMGSEQEVRAFRFYIIFYLLFTASNAVWIWINTGYLDTPGWPWSMINLFAICAASYNWFKYTELRIMPERVRTISFRVVSLLPLAIALLLIVSTPVTHLVFYYNEANEYIHGPLYSTMAVLALLYMIFATVDVALHRSEARSPAQRRQLNVLMLFLIFPMAGGVIDILIPNLPVMELMLLLGFFVVYTNMLQSQMYYDVLTGLNNRRLSDEYLIARLDTVTPEDPLYFFLGDIDNFKQINDTYGHTEGDRALRLVAEGLKEVTANLRCHLARWGGDEFVILIEGENLGSPETLIASIDEHMAALSIQYNLPYTLAMSVGVVECISPDTSTTQIFRDADNRMYEQKKRNKAIAAGSVTKAATS